MRAKIDISEVEVRTKIRAKYLRAIENEEWDLLPGEVYAKSFLRTYGEYLGLDSRQLVDEYKRRYERPTDHELRPIAPLGRERERDAVRAGRCCPPWAGDRRAWSWWSSSSRCTSSASPARAPSSTRRPSTHARVDRPPAAITTPAATARSASPAPTLVKLQLIPTGQVYVCLVNGNGRTLIPGVIYAAGQTIPTKTATKLLLTLGNTSVHDEGQRRHRCRSRRRRAAIGFELLARRHSTPAAAERRSQPHAHDVDGRSATARRDPGHRDRGPDRDHHRPQRAVAVRAPARARRRRGDDPDRRRPPGRPARGARVHARRRGWR